MKHRMSAHEALASLRDGNRRFVSGKVNSDHAFRAPDTPEALQQQKPIAIIVGCSDSRVPAEMVFDQGLGELFVIRVAGNVIANSQIDSVEFAATRFGTPLVIVLGHTLCGAVLATIEELGCQEDQRSASLRSIVERVRPAIEGVIAESDDPGSPALVEQAVRANIRASVQQLQEGSPAIQKLIADDELMIIGAEYSLETGLVEFLD